MSAPALEKSFTISLIGSGNVATHLGLAMAQAGHQVQTIYSRQKQNAEIMARQLKNAVSTNSLDFTQQPVSDIYIIALADAAVPEVIEKALFPANSVVVHTSGSLPLDVLAHQNIQPGVFYPIQTFTKNKPVNLKETPIALEAEDAGVLLFLHDLARSISNKVVQLSSEDRKQLHLAAVFACNFTNHLLGISREILMQHGLNPELLNPLVQATIQKAIANNPFAVQTGPAVRGDANILESHEAQLHHQPLYQEIYRLLSRSIQEKSGS